MHYEQSTPRLCIFVQNMIKVIYWVKSMYTTIINDESRVLRVNQSADDTEPSIMFYICKGLMVSLQNAYWLPINRLWIGCSGYESRNGWPWVWILHGGISWSNDITIYNIWQIYWIPLVGLLLTIIDMFIPGFFVKSWMKCDNTFIQSAMPS